MPYTATTTLNAIRAKSPCVEGWTKLLAHLGKTAADDELLHLLTVLDSNGLDDALWVLQYTGCDERLSRHFGAWCAEQVLPIFEAERPDDQRPRLAIASARDDGATPEARDSAWAAAWDAAWAAAWDAAWDAAWAAARAAAWDAAWDAARAAQTSQLRKCWRKNNVPNRKTQQSRLHELHRAPIIRIR